MQKIIVCIMICLISTTVLAVSNLKMTTEKKLLEDKANYYTIETQYPKLINGDPALKNGVNKMIADTIEQIKKDFFDNLPNPEDLRSIQKSMKMPINAGSNVLEINYKIKLINGHFISILFTQFVNYYGSAHPNSYFRTINYDVNQNKILTLADLFNPQTDYLNQVSQICFKQLKPKLVENNEQLSLEMLQDGLKPTVDNFRDWTLTPKGILFSFPPYQVGPYSIGQQSCLIPYAQLTDKNMDLP